MFYYTLAPFYTKYVKHDQPFYASAFYLLFQVAIPVDGNVTVGILIPKGMTVAECKGTTHLCMLVYGAPMQNLSSFTDNELDNNVFCYNITTLKICSPGMF